MIYPVLAGVLFSFWLYRGIPIATDHTTHHFFSFSPYYIGSRTSIFDQDHSTSFDVSYAYKNNTLISKNPGNKDYLDVLDLALWEIIPQIFSDSSPVFQNLNHSERSLTISHFLGKDILSKNNENILLLNKFDQNRMPIKNTVNGKALSQEELFHHNIQGYNEILNSLKLPKSTKIGFTSEKPHLRSYIFESNFYKLVLSLNAHDFTVARKEDIPENIKQRSNNLPINRQSFSVGINYTQKKYAELSDTPKFYQEFGPLIINEFKKYFEPRQ